MQKVLLWGEVGTGVTVERLLLHLKHSHWLCTGTLDFAFWILRMWVLIPSGCRRWRAQKLNLFSLPLYASWISSGFWDYHWESLTFLLYLQILILKKGHVKVKAGVTAAAEWIPAGYCQWQDEYWVTFTKIFMSQRKLYHWSCGPDFECVCFPYLPRMQQSLVQHSCALCLAYRAISQVQKGDSWQMRRLDFFFDATSHQPPVKI